MSKVLLIIPPCFINPELDFEIGFPVNLLLLGRHACTVGWDVSYLDMTLEEKEGSDSFDSLNQRLQDQSIKIVGISNHTVRTSITTRRVAERIKSLRPDVRVLVGGVNATFMWKELLQECPEIDFILRGYAQPGLRTLLTPAGDINLKAVPGLVVRNGGSFHIEPSVPVKPDDFAAPNLEGVDVLRYLQWTNTYPLLTHTGCGFSCNFCTSVMPGPYQNKEVFRPVEDVLREIRQAIDAGFNRFFMTANIFTSNRAYCLELCDALRNDAGLGEVVWTCMTRVEFVDEDLLLVMREAGCQNIAFGIETAGLEQWRRLRKGRFSEEAIYRAFRLTKNMGVGTTAYLMLGTPTQTQAEIDATVDLVYKLDPDYRVVSFFQPFPGTPYWENPAQFGLAEIAPLEDWNFHEAPICRTIHLDKQSLLDAALRFYLDRDSRVRLDLDDSALEILAGTELVYHNMPLPARDAFLYQNGSLSVRELLEYIEEKHGARGRIIALYWLSAAIRERMVRVVSRMNIEQGEDDLVIV